MSLKFIYGDAGSSRSGTLISELITRSVNEPDKNFFIIVPEQFTLQTQRSLTTSHPDKGILNIDVLSFERLAYRIFDETGIVRRALLEESGKSLILKKILLDKKKELPYLGSRLGGGRSTEDLKSLISELMQYNISPEDLDSVNTGSTDAFGEKLRDIALIFRNYKDYLSRTYMTVEEIPLILSSVIEKSELLKGSVVAFDGFTGFTPVQLPVIKNLLKTASDVYVTVIIPPDQASGPNKDPYDLFRMSRDTVTELTGLAKEAGAQVSAPLTASPVPRSRDLRFLSDNIYRRKRAALQETPDSVHINACASPLDEVRLAASVINRLVRTKGYRFRDIAVVSGDRETYPDLIRRVFPDTEIPYFIDDKSTVMTNSFVELIRSALSVIEENYSYASVFRMLKTGLTALDDETVCILENYAITLGIRGRRRWETEFIHYSKYENQDSLPAINEARQYVCDILAPLSQAFSERMSTVRQKTTALYEFITSLNAQETLEKYAADFELKGKAELAAEYSRIYKTVMDLLDKTVSVLGDEKISTADYISILESILGDTKMGFIPPGNDSVTCGDIKRTRLSGVKALLFLGVNDGIIPAVPGRSGLITENERKVLEASGSKLAPDSREALFTERFYLYLTLSIPSDELYISYAMTSGQGESLKPSTLTGTVKKLFPLLETGHADIYSPELLEHPGNSADALTAYMHDPDKRKAFLELYKYLSGDPFYSRRLDVISKMTGRDPVDDTIGKAVSRALYGESMTVSPTRLEMFALCRFRHFLSHGLRLKERQEFTFTGMDMGNIIHHALEWYSTEVARSGRKWTDISGSERDSLCEHAIDLETEAYGNLILKDNARTAYETERLKRLLKRTVWALTMQLSKGDFVPYAFEEKVFIPLTDEISLKGTIDRIDICDTGDAILVKTIDYKTGSVKFDINALYNGTQLQLPLYTKAAIKKIQEKTGRPAVPAAMFYFGINDPLISPSEEEIEGSGDELILKELIPNGLIAADNDILCRFDRGLSEPQTKSLVIKASTTKSGAPGKSSSLISSENFYAVEDYAGRKAASLARDIMSGSVTVSPVKNGTSTSCDYCPFRPVCRFNPSHTGCTYRTSDKKAEDIWKIISGDEDNQL